MKTTLLVFAALPLVVSCARSNVGPSSQSASPNPQSEFKVNGQSSSDYFKQFVVHVKGTCDKPETLAYVSASTSSITLWGGGNIILSKADENGKTRLADADLLMAEDGTYELRYREIEAFNFNGATVSAVVKKGDSIKGAWLVEKDSLVLTNLGKATGLKLNDRDGFDLKIEHFEVNPALVGETMTFALSYSDKGPNNELPGDTCQK